jgi:hypothetical protein
MARVKQLIPNGAIRSAMRRLWLYSWQRKEVLKRASSGHGKVCAKCLKTFHVKGVEVDHINPVGYAATWNEYVLRLFCSVDGLRVVCKKCHKRITAKQLATHEASKMPPNAQERGAIAKTI